MRAFLAPVLLLLVAVVQIWLTVAAGLTPWKGGGFGMFATLDHVAFRRLTLTVDAPDRSEGLEVPPSLETLAARVSSCPVDWLMRRLGTEVADRERGHERPVTHVTIDVWRTEFDPQTLHAEERLLRHYVYAVTPAASARP